MSDSNNTRFIRAFQKRAATFAAIADIEMDIAVEPNESTLTDLVRSRDNMLIEIDALNEEIRALLNTAGEKTSTKNILNLGIGQR